MTEPAQWVISIAGAYLLGSVPFGLLLGKLKGIDIRAHGSGNIGATNVLRVLGKPIGISCFILDVGKGLAPVLVAGWWTGALGAHTVVPSQQFLWMAVAAAAIAGHMFSVFLRFKGGKGVATGLGAILGVWPDLTFAALLAAVTWIIIARLTRYVSVASCAAAGSLALWALVVHAVRMALRSESAAHDGHWAAIAAMAGVLLLVGAVVIWKHRANLARVRKGAEPKIGSPLEGDNHPSK